MWYHPTSFIWNLSLDYFFSACIKSASSSSLLACRIDQSHPLTTAPRTGFTPPDQTPTGRGVNGHSPNLSLSASTCNLSFPFFFSSSTAFSGHGLHLTHHALLTRGLEATMNLGTRRRLVAASTYDRTMPGLAKVNAKCQMRMSNLVSRLRWDTRWASSARLGLAEMKSKPFPSSSSSSTGSLFLSQTFHFPGGTFLVFPIEHAGGLRRRASSMLARRWLCVRVQRRHRLLASEGRD